MKKIISCLEPERTVYEIASLDVTLKRDYRDGKNDI